MITGGHIAVSYLMAEGAKYLGVPLNNDQILGVILMGNLPDIDFLFGLAHGEGGESHHRKATHTIFGIILMWLTVVIIFRPEIYFSLVLLTTLFVHLLLDDLGQMFAKLKIYYHTSDPQINWLYPFTPYSKHKIIMGNREALKHYVIKGWPIAVLELILIILAVLVYLRN
jgi:Predicted membrane-bound metal-dependent hydrolase (DUF457).